MISAADLSGYALASFVLIVIPGLSALFVVGRALAYGRRTALATVAGNAAGNYLVAACAPGSPARRGGWPSSAGPAGWP